MPARQKIPPELIPIIYDISKKVYDEKITQTEGAKILFNKHKVKISSSKGYITNFKSMMQGKQFKRNLNAFSMEYFIANIKKDYGDEQLFLALTSLKSHIIYYEAIRKNIEMYPLRSILKTYSGNKYSFLNIFSPPLEK